MKEEYSRNLKSLLSTCINRINKESKETTVTANIIGDNKKHWRGTIFGSKDTPYEGGVFVIDILIPDKYPFAPPKMKFLTKIWHPNISSVTGAICLDILKNEWTPALTIRTALISLQALMCAPEPDDPQDAEVAQQYKFDRKAYAQKAKNWTSLYAKGDTPENKEALKKVMELGFTEQESRTALESHEWKVEDAINSLLK